MSRLYVLPWSCASWHSNKLAQQEPSQACSPLGYARELCFPRPIYRKAQGGNAAVSCLRGVSLIERRFGSKAPRKGVCSQPIWILADEIPARKAAFRKSHINHLCMHTSRRMMAAIPRHIAAVVLQPASFGHLKSIMICHVCYRLWLTVYSVLNFADASKLRTNAAYPGYASDNWGI